MKLDLVNIWKKCHVYHLAINTFFITLREKGSFRFRTLPLYRSARIIKSDNLHKLNISIHMKKNPTDACFVKVSSTVTFHMAK